MSGQGYVKLCLVSMCDIWSKICYSISVKYVLCLVKVKFDCVWRVCVIGSLYLVNMYMFACFLTDLSVI